MAYLLKMLTDMLQNPQPLSHFQICPKPKVKLCSTDLIYPAPPSSFDIATARNPRQFGLTDTDLSLTEMAMQILCFPSYHFGLTEMSDWSHRVDHVGLTENPNVHFSNRIGLTEFTYSV